jgi:hypothetical protein
LFPAWYRSFAARGLQRCCREDKVECLVLLSVMSRFQEKLLSAKSKNEGMSLVIELKKE